MAKPLATSTPEFPRVPGTAEGIPAATDRSLAHWYSDWGNLALIPLAAMVAVYLLWLVFQWGSEQTVVLIQEIAFIPLMAMGAIFSFRAARLFTVDRRMRNAWMFIGTGLLAWLIGDTGWALQVVFGDQFHVFSMSSIGFIFSGLLIVIGTLTFPSIGISGRARRVFRLDSAIILTGIIAMVAFFVIEPDRLRYPVGSAEALSLFAFAAATTITLYLVYHTIVRRPAAGVAGPLILIAAGLTIVAVSNLVWIYFEVRGDTVAGGPIYGFWMIGQTLLILSPQLHYDQIRRGRAFPGIDAIVDRSHSFVPYVASAIGTAVLMTTGIYILVDRLGVVVLLVVALIGLIVSRQIVSLRQNAQLRAEQAIRETEIWFSTLVRYSSDMVTVIDREFRCGYQSPSASDVSCHLPQSPVGSLFLEWVHPGDRPRVQRALDKVLGSDSDATTAKVEWRLCAGEEVPIHFETIISNRLSDPTVNGLVLNSRDVSERKQLEDRLTFQAFHDPLTNLPNRAQFFSDLAQAIRRADEGCGLALLFVDIDDFKLINDRFGHDVGDRFLRQFAQRLEEILNPGEVLSRLAGDEFTIIVKDIERAEDAMSVANRFLSHLQEPVRVAGAYTSISTSIGVVFTLDADTDPDDLVHRSDIAMYQAKRQGPGNAALYEPWMEDELTGLGRTTNTVEDERALRE